MEIYLVRHTKPLIDIGVCYGQSDIPLADTFAQELRQVKTKLPQTFDSVYSSPLLRCTNLAKTFGQNVILKSELMEMNFGDWEMKKWDEIPENQLNPWMNNFVKTKVPGGESFEELINRVELFISDLLTQGSKKLVSLHMQES